MCLLCGYWYYCWTGLLIYFFLRKEFFRLIFKGVRHTHRYFWTIKEKMYAVVRIIKGTHSMDLFPYSILIVIFSTEIKSKPDQARFGTSLSCLCIYQTIFCRSSHTQLLFSNPHDTVVWHKLCRPWRRHFRKKLQVLWIYYRQTIGDIWTGQTAYGLVFILFHSDFLNDHYYF